MKSLASFIVILLSTISCHLAAEQIRYIDDTLYVPLRSGQSSQFRVVHKGLVSGTAVTLLETSEDGKYSLVRTRGGTEGWTQTRFLNEQPASRDLLKIANQSIDKLKQQNRDLQTRLTETRQQRQQINQQLSKTSKDFSKTQQELDTVKNISAQSLQLNEDNQRLLKENQMLKKQVNVLSTDNQRLNDNKENEAFLNGALAVAIGAILALLVPRLLPKKRSDWD